MLVSICQLQPPVDIENRCSFYGYIPTAEKKFSIKAKDLVHGNVYCVEIASKTRSLVVNAGVFLVVEKACDYGKCVPIAFIYTWAFFFKKKRINLDFWYHFSDTEDCYSPGQNFTFSYKAACFYDDQVAEVELCSSIRCTPIGTTPLISGTYTTEIGAPLFQSEFYVIRFWLNNNLVIQSSTFLVSADCQTCISFRVTPWVLFVALV